MNAMERLKNAMVQVRSIIDFHQQFPTGMTYPFTDITIKNLEILLDGLADRDISLKSPKFVSQKEMERDIGLAKILVGERETWVDGYDKGYKAGRDGEAMRVREIVNRLLGG